ncbi:uncharacterized protein LOC133837336 isoform X1 [Drosophila sulfurigaster albostrigata]|uniref:uncharacterized protein LOC133837336 isoform X1 n=2 Tax=Drosophila sulfurigaster albostrigata TaxID=89887 RepID=UPI002D21CE3E|nr:uncharacterized protein LOC133837336 isoform X1 [Drosophila sulfurigaster albostrigata]
MDINLSLEHYEEFYKLALAAQEQAHVAPKCLRRVEELQLRCRICGCLDDGSFVDLDAVQDFEFEPSICSYRELFQRTSLQFQFHTMPDLPSRLCIRCGYKAKIFYLMTRQFVYGQNALRSTVTDWYHTKYQVEPPEQIEDRKRLMKQLALTEAAQIEAKRKEMQATKPLTPVKDLIKGYDMQGSCDLKRSISVDNRLNTTGIPSQLSSESHDRKIIKEGQQMVRSTINLGGASKIRSPTVKGNNQSQLPQSQQSQTARNQVHRAETPKTPFRERFAGLKSDENRECQVTPRVMRSEARGSGGRGDRALLKTQSNRKILDTTSTAEGKLPQSQEFPPSKAQLLQKLQERRRQWR